MITFTGTPWRLGAMLSRVERRDDRWHWTLALSLGHRRVVLGRRPRP